MPNFGPGMKLERIKEAPLGFDPSKIDTVPDTDFGEAYWFWCYPCDTHHKFTTKLAKGAQEHDDRRVELEQLRENEWAKREKRKPQPFQKRPLPLWTFNGNMASPTFTPSLKYDSVGCHLHLRNGMLEYCADSKHRMAGKSILLGEVV